MDCAPAKMVWAAVYQGIMATTGVRLAITEPLVQWSRLKKQERKRLSKQQIKDTMSIVSAGRSTLYRLYYAKIENLTEMTLLDMLSKSFRSIKTIAKMKGPLSRLHRLTGCVRPTGPTLADLIQLARSQVPSMSQDGNVSRENADDAPGVLDVHGVPDVPDAPDIPGGHLPRAARSPPHPPPPPHPSTSPGNNPRNNFFSTNRLAAAISQANDQQAEGGQPTIRESLALRTGHTPATTVLRGTRRTPHQIRFI